MTYKTNGKWKEELLNARSFALRLFDIPENDIKLSIKVVNHSKKRMNLGTLKFNNEDNSHGRVYMNVAMYNDGLCTYECVMDGFFHEMVHFKQVYFKDLIACFNHVIWKGKRYGNEDLPYFKRPWEMEAFETSPKLLEKWMEMQ